MSGKTKSAWITTVTDEVTAQQAVVLAKSLARVNTTADMIALTSEDLNHSLLKLLAQYFVSVFPVGLKKNQLKTKLEETDLLKLYACNFEIYSKRIVLSPNQMFLQNCDELFELDCDFHIFATSNPSGRFSISSIFILKPASKIYTELMNVAMSSQCLGVSDIIACGKGISVGEQTAQIHSMYWNNLADVEQNQLDLQTVKIVTYDSNDTLSSRIIRDASNLSWGEDHQNIPNRAQHNNAVAIIGLSCRFPGSNSAAEFWNFLKDGGDGICAVPRERLENSKLLDPQLEKFHGCFLKCPIDEFDSKFFEISPREAAIIDPQQRLLLEVSWEALENAGINPLSLRGGNAAVFSGIGQMEQGKLVAGNSSTSMLHNVSLGNSFSFSSARISNFLGLNGPNIYTESSSSLLALHLAVESLKRGETDVAIVAGANLIANIVSWDGNSLPAKDWHCKTFDEKADGYVRGEGIAVLVLKRVPDALKDGDRVRGILKGSAVSNDGTTSTFGTPNKACQECVIREALKNAGVRPEDVDYIEANGPGTHIGDPVEFGAISANYSCERAKPLVISSVKKNIGPTEAASGLAGIIKVILAMEHETIPPHRNFDIINPKINLDEIPAVLPLREMAWKRDPQRVRLAGISSFGISGTNVHVLLEEPPKEQKFDYMVEGPAESRMPSHILTLSAKTQNALDDLRGNFLKYLKMHPKIDMGDLSFTLNTGRAIFKHRLSVVAENILDLTKAVENKSYIRPTLKDAPKIAFVFSEGGPRYLEMVITLYRRNLVFRNSLDTCIVFVKEKCGIDFMEDLWKKQGSSPLPDDISNKLSIFSAQYSFFTLLTSFNVTPEVVVGHGVGELAAAVASGIMNLKDALLLLIVTGPFIANFPEERMLALKQSSTAIKYQTPKCKYISGNSGSIRLDGELLSGSYWLQLPKAKGQVNFEKAVQTLHDLKCNVILDVGLSSAFITSMGNISAAGDILKLPTLDENKNDWAQLLETLGHLYTNGVDINWKSIYTPEVRRKLDLPTYPFQREFLKAVNSHKIEIPEVHKHSVAIIGLSCRFPGANSSDELWDLLKIGGDGIKTVSTDRLKYSQMLDPDIANFKGGFLKCPIDEFDAQFFEISPREAEIMDPQQRLLLEVAWEALENAAINPLMLQSEKTGVFTGAWQCEYEKFVKENTDTSMFHSVFLGNSFSALSSRISYFLGLNGPNIAIESGCSSSMVALHLASESLKRGEIDLALVMGVNLLVNLGCQKGSPLFNMDGRCKTFDEKADGFVRSEGLAVLVLKRLPDAVKDGDRIRCILRGIAMSSEGTSSSFGTPTKACQEIAIREALKNASVYPDEVDYVEAHGTGTPVGDPVEFGAIAANYTSNRKIPLIIGSVKTNIGHTESAAGLAGIIKVILSMEHEIIPRHINFESLNPLLDLDSVPAILPLTELSWNRNPKRARIAGVSSFAIGGTNAHAIIEESPIKIKYADAIFLTESIKKQKPSYILNLSAKSESSLLELVERYINHLKKYPNIDIADLTFTANVGRAHFKHRLSFISKNIAELTCSLEKHNFVLPASQVSQKVAFIFTGEGSQYSGMALGLYENSSTFKTAFDSCVTIIDEFAGINLVDMLWNKEGNTSQTEKYSCNQLAIFSIQYSLFTLFSNYGMQPEIVLGHGIGEYAACVASGIMGLRDALELLITRSQLIANLSAEGRMVKLNTSREKCKELISSFLKKNRGFWVDITAINSPQQVVVTGQHQSIEEFQHFCTKQSIEFEAVALTRTVDARDMDKIQNSFKQYTNKIIYSHSKYQYISGTTGNLLSVGEMLDGSYWLKHLREPVNFHEAINTLYGTGCNLLIEIGPSSPTLLSIAKDHALQTDEIQMLPTLQQNKNDWNNLLQALGKMYSSGIDINWLELYPANCNTKLELPTYPFQKHKYWINILAKNKERQVYSLLGKRLSLAANTNNIVYTNNIKLADFSYLRDHQVANVVLMPGAAFLEIILQAGTAALLSRSIFSKNVLVVEDFAIDAALEIQEDNIYDIQVVISPSQNRSSFHGSLYVSTPFINDSYNEQRWIKHASALLRLQPMNADVLSQYYIREHLSDIKSRCQKETLPEDIYIECKKMGILLEGAFQCLSSLVSTDGEILACVSTNNLPGNINEYVYHPIILDAMLQVFWLKTQSRNSCLTLPAGIENVFVFNRNFSDLVYIHARLDDQSDSGTVALYNENSDLLVLMVGIRFVQTSIKSLLGAITAQRNVLPEFYHEVLQPRLGHNQSRIDLGRIKDLSSIIQPVEESMKGDMSSFDPHLTNAIKNEFVCLKLINIFIENNVSFKVGKKYYTSDVSYDIGVDLSHVQFFNRIIDIYAEDGYISRLDSDSWTISKEFPNIADIEKRLTELEITLLEYDKTGTTILVKCMDNIWNVVHGKKDPVSALFDRQDMDLLDLYTKGLDCRLGNIRLANSIKIVFQDRDSLFVKQEVSTVRIVEIGGGSASSSIEILTTLRKCNIPCQYTFTDVSPQFFKNAANVLSVFNCVEYKVLDIEKDPVTQSFFPNYYDIVVASNVIHATEDLKTSIRNIRTLLKKGGMLFLQEQLKQIRSSDVIFGILDSYWRFKDTELRKNGPMVSKDVWDNVLLENGFEVSFNLSNPAEITTLLVSKSSNASTAVVSTSDTPPSTWLIIGDDDIVSDKVATNFASPCTEIIYFKYSNQINQRSHESGGKLINLLNESSLKEKLDRILNSKSIMGIVYLSLLGNDGEEDNDACLKALNFCKYVTANVHSKMKILVVTRGGTCTESQQIISPTTALIWGIMKSIKNEAPMLSVFLVDLDTDSFDEQQDAEFIFFESFESQETVVYYRRGKRFVPRYAKWEEQLGTLHTPHGQFKMQTPKTKNVEDLCFVAEEKRILGKNDIEIAVMAYTLNFKDIILILTPEITDSSGSYAGKDYSGIVTSIGSSVTQFRVGDQVFGMGLDAFSSRIIVDISRIVYHKPKYMNFVEAATIPSAYATAHYCLFKIAKLTKKDTVLIHVASGGVGLFAIQIIKTVGASLIVTAGNRRKRMYLRSLGIENVFHSRDLSFGENIKRATGGRGVDIVINSLTGPGFKETTLESCATNARFVEIGMLNIWDAFEVNNRRSDVEYTVVDFQTVGREELAHCMDSFINENVHRPIPYTIFEMPNIRVAFNYFIKANHIGKVALTLPSSSHTTNYWARDDNMFFNTGGTYVVTGGLNGLGLEVAKWMAAEGVECLVLVGRSPPKAEALNELNIFRGRGCQVLTFEVDIGNSSQCKNLFQTIFSSELKLPPLKGIIHSAGVLSNATFANQSWDTFQKVLNSKVRGCWNLHNSTKDINLDHFVLFSSMAAIFAPIGQSNHTSANCFLDSFAHYRHSIGLPAQTINWGAWSEVGAAVNTIYDTKDAVGLNLNPKQGLAALKFIMSRPDLCQLGVAQFRAMGATLLSMTNGLYFSELFQNTENNCDTDFKSGPSSEKFWKHLETMSLAERLFYIQSKLANFIKKIVKLSEKDLLSEHQNFSELGMDSLMTIELKNKIQIMLGEKMQIGSISLNGNQTLHKLSRCLAEITFECSSNIICTNGDTVMVDNSFLLDSILPSDIKGTENFVHISEVRNILLTGSTGQMAVYFLEEFIKNTSIKVFCLVRGKSVEHAKQRLVTKLEELNLSKCVLSDRVSVIVGDIVVEKLGLSNEQYEDLSRTVDAVFHLAAKINLFENYNLETDYDNDIRSVNVQGTINVLRFCANIKTKHLLFSSTIAAVNRLTPNGAACEDFPEDDNNADQITMGYALSKFLCEKLIKQAIGRGIPCKVVRYHNVVGNSDTGRFSSNLDFFMNILLMSIKLGVIFEGFQRFHILPADSAAKLTVQLFFNENAKSDLYNLWQPIPVMLNDIVTIVTELGYKLNIVSDDEFSDKMRQENDSPFSYMFKTTNGSDFLFSFYSSTFIAKQALAKDSNVCQISTKLTLAIPDICKNIIGSKLLLKRCITYAESSGMLKNRIGRIK